MDLWQQCWLLFIQIIIISFHGAVCNQTPVISVGAGTLATIAEDSSVGTSVYKCNATDPDASNTDDGTLRYFISPDVSGLIVDANTCEVYVAPGLDYESSTTLSGTLTVEDKNGLKDVGAFTFAVSDANDNTPVCDPNTVVGELAEDAAAGSTIGTFACTDADEANTVNSDISFVVFPVSNAIDVNGTTGEIFLKRTIDYETDGPSITATVRARDNGSTRLTSTATVVLVITDVDDNIPAFDAGSLTATHAEDTAVGTTLATLVATDADEPNSDNSEITFGLTSACSPDVILLDPKTGDLVLKSSLDYETTSSVTCALSAYSSTKSSDTTTATFTLTVDDVNDETPTFNQTYYTASVSENEPANTLVINMTATDGDSGANGQVTYAMADATNTFQIDSSTGEVTVKTAPNYETATSYLFLVTAEDGAASPVTSSIYLQILIEPVNEFTPSFQDSPSISGISEDTVPGTVIHNISISDDDSGADGEITYSVLTAGVPFFVDIAGAIRVGSDLDYDAQTSYEFVVQASDSSTTTVKTATVTYTVALTDVDDVALSCEPVSTIVLTGAPAANLNFVQATLNCSDPDTSAGTLTYAITDGNSDGAWTVNAGGQVSLQSQPSISQYNLTITVTDGTNSTTVDFTAFTETTLAFTNVPVAATTVDENTSGTTFLTASACCAYGEVVYEIAGGNSDNKVAIVSSTGELKHLMPYDRETTASYEYVIQAVSASGQTATATYTVSVGDANDNTPLYAQNVYQINVAETLAVSAPIATYTATDADEGSNANLTYSIASGNDAGDFTIDANTGILELAGTLNYDVTPRYELVIEAVDQGDAPALTGSTTVVISVVNAEDSAPTIIPLPGSYSVSLSEDVALGTSVFDVEATDGDNGTSFTFAIESGNTDSDFGIDPSSGYIFVSKFLDRERTATYTLTLTAVDSLFSSTASGTLVVTIDDVNDNSPVFTPSVFEFDVDHDTAAGVSVGDIVVSDDDDGVNAAITTTIIAGNVGNAFTLSGLQVDTAATTDYTSINYYRITLQAVDGGTPARTTTTVMVINVLPDVEQPDFGATTTATVTINEDTEVGYQIYDVDATYLGAVEGDGSTLYSIFSGDASSQFGIRSQNGQVYLASALDFETTETYTLVIRAQNSVQTTNTADFTLTVNVVNINEHNPIFDQISSTGQGSFSFDVDESATVGTTVGQVSASDDDSGDPGTVVHTISGSTDFTIASDTGIITVNGALDYTVQNVYNLVVTATDQGSTSRSDAVSVVVRVIDVNNNPPVFTSANTAQVLDSATVGSEFFHVHATDVDTDAAGTIKYSILTDPSVGKLSLDASTGILSVAGQLDAALESSYVLTIKAEDEGTPNLETTQTLTVTVVSTTPNYYSPVFPTSPASASVNREAAAGTTIVVVSATDNDSGTSGDIIHRIVAGNTDGYFLIDRSTGTISTASSVLNAENSYTLTIEACDLGVPSQSTNRTIDISVSPVRTVLTTPDYVFTIAEDATVGDLVGEILQDTSRTASSYVISSGNYDTSFSITLDGGTGRGQLNTAKALDYETFQIYSLVVDVGTDVGDYSKVVEVRLTDVNDNPPTFSSNSLTLTIEENMPVGYTVTTISVTDADTDAINRDNLLSLSNPGPDLFSIDQSGHLTIATSPDFETVGSQRIFDVVGADQQPPRESATVTVTVNIVDVVETEDRRLSSLTETSMIPLEVHFPATDGDIIHILSPGDFGIEESSSATVDYVTFNRNFPFSISSSGEVTVSDANSLTYPGKFFHWVLCRSTVNDTTTSRVSLIRLDTYDRNDYMVVIEFLESLDNVRSGLENFRFRAKEFLSDNQRMGISLLTDTSTDTRRRLLTTQTAAYAYVVSDTSIDDLANIDQDKQFFTEAEILAVFQKNADGSPTNGLSTTSMSISVVEPFDDRNGDNDFATSTAGITLWALLGVFVLAVVVIIAICVWWRNTRDPKIWTPGKKSKTKTKDAGSNTFLTLNTDRSPPSSAPTATRMGRSRQVSTGTGPSEPLQMGRSRQVSTGTGPSDPLQMGRSRQVSTGTGPSDPLQMDRSRQVSTGTGPSEPLQKPPKPNSRLNSRVKPDGAGNESSAKPSKKISVRSTPSLQN